MSTQRLPDIRDAICVPVALAIGIAGVDPTIPAGAGAVGSELCARLAPRRQAGRCLAIEPRARPNPGLHQCRPTPRRSEEHTSELQSLMRNSYAVFCLKKKNY